MARGRPPDFVLKIMDKGSGRTFPRVGAAWNNPNGSIGIVFDSFFQLPSYPANQSMSYTLFPYDKEHKHGPSDLEEPT